MDKSPLGIHEIKLVVQPPPSFSNSSCVGEHADSSLDLGKVTPRHNGWRLVVDPNLEPCGTPVNELDRALGLDCRYGCIHILGNNISAVEHTAGHVLPNSWVTLDHLVCWLKAGVGNLSHRELLVIGLLSTNDWGIGDQREVNPRVWNQVCLELSQVNIECSVKSERCRYGGDNLTNQAVKVPLTNVIDGLIVHHEGAV